MRYSKLVAISALGVLIGILFSVPAFAADVTDINVYQNSSYKVVGHHYEGLPTSFDSSLYAGGTVSNITKYEYRWDIPISIDIHVRGLESLAADQTFSGYLVFPIISQSGVNSTATDYVTNHNHLYESYLLPETYTLTSQNGNGISYNFYYESGVPMIAVSFDSVPVTSVYRSADNSYYISVNFDYNSGWVYTGDSDLISQDVLPSLSYLFTLSFSTNIASTWVSGLTHNLSLTSMITQAINNASDLDTIISILRSCSSSLSTWNQNFDAGFFASEIQTAVVDAIDSSTDVNSIISILNVIRAYSENLDDILAALNPSQLSSVIDSSTDVNSIITLLSILADSDTGLVTQILNSSTTINTTLSNIYSLLSTWNSSYTASIVPIMGNLNSMIYRLSYAFTGGANPTGIPYEILNTATTHWVNLIKEALSDFEITVNVDNDQIVSIEVTNNDVTNIYNDHEIIQNFETNIELNFGEAFQDIDWNILNNGSDIVTVDFISTTERGTGLIQRMYNALGPYNVLVTITLFVGLVAALLGPINRFVSKRIN